MAETIYSYQRQAPFIEERAEKLLESVFGEQGLADQPGTIPAFEVAGLSPQQQAAIQRAQAGLGAYQPDLEAARTTIGTGLGALSSAQQVLDPSQVSTYMDPYHPNTCLLYTSPSPRDRTRSRMPSSA